MDKVQSKLNSYIEKDSIPNILFYGPYMSGKEEISQKFIKKLYKTSENISKYVMTINCLSTNGIKTIKEYIKLFSMQIFNKTPNINFKTIVLEHCDNLTYDSQYSLRRTIEQYSKTTRFIFICENKYKLLNPLCSRFAHIYINNTVSHKSIYNNYDKFNYNKYNSIISKYDDLIHNSDDKNVNILNEIYKISLEFYTHNFYCFEILQKFKDNPNYTNYCLIYRTVHQNFNNELFSIFNLLVLFRNNYKIQIYEYY